MKLLFCPTCHDVRKLQVEVAVECQCGKSWGYYEANRHDAVIGGKATCIGFVNSSFARALRNQPRYGQGERFLAFVTPVWCKTIRVAADHERPRRGEGAAR